MQPYLFPYIGYFQLLSHVDRFVFYDDVNFIKNGWINRNRLGLDGEAKYFTVPLNAASAFQKIRDVAITPADGWRRKLGESIRHAYRKAPHFAPVSSLVANVFDTDTLHIGQLAKTSVRQVANYLGLKTEFIDSSVRYGNADLRGMDRVLDICRREQATDYFNVPGGRALYEPGAFVERGIRLHFIEPLPFEYAQGKSNFLPSLSIIDVLMYNDPARVRELLAHCAVT